MPIAAVPAYLGTDFKDASPGLRFGLLLPIWTNRQDQEADVRKRAERKSREGQEVADMLQRQGMDATIKNLCQRQSKPLVGLWDKNDFAAKKAWDVIKSLTKADQERMKNLLARQSTLAVTLPADQLLRLEAIATAPFTTGLGNEHPLENGFAFLNPYGLPYLPGSGVKGVLRQAARELASGEWGDTHGWDAALPSPSGRGAGGEGISAIDALFGKEDSNDAQRGALAFWDVITQIKGDSLMVEIMTPHQSHYYQQKRDRKSGDSTTPHDSGQPTPISYLTVPPGSGFAFHVVCDLAFLRRLAPALAENNQWKNLLRAAFVHAFAWCGFGAKTAVGYGAMERDIEAEARAAREQTKREADAQRQREEAERQAQREAELAKLSPIEREITEFLDGRPDKNQPEISAVIGAIKQERWQGDDKITVATWLKTRMQATKGQWKESSQAKKPEKDKEYQNTLLVMRWLDGK